MRSFRRPEAEADKLVAIVVPLSTRPELSPEEEISIRHLEHFLGRYDRFLIKPKSLDFERTGFEAVDVPDRFFGSLEAHTQLSLNAAFYESFRDYKFMLMYHLDCLVFSDQLEEWCKKDYDYIGAPFFKCEDSPWVNRRQVGNSGFSLRKIESFLKVFHSKEHFTDPDAYWRRIVAEKTLPGRLLRLPKKYLKKLTYFNGVRSALQNYQGNDDRFFADLAPKFYPDFRIADFEEGLKFAFEVNPRKCFEMNGRKLPFGCHAWAKYDRAFWEPHLLTPLRKQPSPSLPRTSHIESQDV